MEKPAVPRPPPPENSAPGIVVLDVRDPERPRLLGRIPTAWFPTAVEPSADGRTLYFSCWGDIWCAPRDGSAPATRLTDNVALEERPVLSPDGKQLAFISDRFGNLDVFVMPAEGGAATRLTYSDAPDQHYCWKRDGSALLGRQHAPDQNAALGRAVHVDHLDAESAREGADDLR